MPHRALVGAGGEGLVTFVDLQLFGSVEFPDPPPEPEVVDELPQPTKASASAADAARNMPRRSAGLRSLKLISVLTIGFREIGKIGSGEKVREALGEFYASLCWAERSVGDLGAQQNRDRPLRILGQQIVGRGTAVDQSEVSMLR